MQVLVLSFWQCRADLSIWAFRHVVRAKLKAPENVKLPSSKKWSSPSASPQRRHRFLHEKGQSVNDSEQGHVRRPDRIIQAIGNTKTGQRADTANEGGN